MSELEDELQQKAGPLPVWGWGVLLAAVFVIYLSRKRASAAANVAAVTSNGPVDPTLTSSAGSNGDPTQSPFPNGPMASYLSQSPTNTAYPVGMTAQGVPGPVTNGQWSRLALDFILSHGGAPIEASSALAKYLGSGARDSEGNAGPIATLSRSEQAYINEALQAFGAPPEGMISAGMAPVPAPAAHHPAPAPNPGHGKWAGTIYTVKVGDSLSSVSLHFYGVDPHGPYRIASDNAYALGPGYHQLPTMLTKKLPVGAKINIPPPPSGAYPPGAQR